MRGCFERFSCLHPEADHWLQATLSTESGGLGLRSMASHASAAFLASRSACAPLCREIDPQHSFFTDSLPSPERVAISDYNARVNEEAQLSATAITDWQQKDLSHALDKRVFMQLIEGFLFFSTPMLFFSSRLVKMLFYSTPRCFLILPPGCFLILPMYAF